MRYTVQVNYPSLNGRQVNQTLEFSYPQTFEPHNDTAFLQAVARLLPIEAISSEEIVSIDGKPEAGEAGYSDPNTLDMFLGA